jgi:mannose/fructose/N-acetylgalactosamine-specific phosphotransferase system component IIC
VFYYTFITFFHFLSTSFADPKLLFPEQRHRSGFYPEVISGSCNGTSLKGRAGSGAGADSAASQIAVKIVQRLLHFLITSCGILDFTFHSLWKVANNRNLVSIVVIDVLYILI